MPPRLREKEGQGGLDPIGIGRSGSDTVSWVRVEQTRVGVGLACRPFLFLSAMPIIHNGNTSPERRKGGGVDR